MSDSLDKITAIDYKGDSGFSSGLLSELSEEESIASNHAVETKANLWEKYYSQDCDGDTLLHEAILFESPKIVELIIKIAPDSSYLNIPNDNAETPLHLATKANHPQTIRNLIVAGCRPSPRDIFGDSPLHIACRNGDIRCVQALLEPVQVSERNKMGLLYKIHVYAKMDLEQWNYLGQTCTHVAAINGHIDVLYYLYKNGVDINAREGLMGYTPLHFAVDRGNERMISFLLRECPKLDLEVRSYGGKTARQLHVAETDEESDGSEESDSDDVRDLEKYIDSLSISL